MDFTRIAVFSVVVPLFASLLGFFLVGRFLKVFWQQAIGIVVVTSLVILSSYTAAMGVPTFPFRDANQILLFAGPLTAWLLTLGIRAEPPRGTPRFVRGVLLAVILSALYAWILRPVIENDWGLMQTGLTLFGLGVVIGGFTAYFSEVSRTMDPGPGLFVTGASLAIFAAAIGGSGSVLVAEMGGMVALITLALLLMRGKFDPPLTAIWAQLIFAVFGVGVLLLGAFYAAMSPLTALVLLAGSFFSWVVCLRLAQVRKPALVNWALYGLVVIFFAAPGLGMVGYANYKAEQAKDSSGYDY